MGDIIYRDNNNLDRISIEGRDVHIINCPNVSEVDLRRGTLYLYQSQPHLKTIHADYIVCKEAIHLSSCTSITEERSYECLLGLWTPKLEIYANPSALRFKTKQRLPHLEQLTHYS